MVMIMSRIGINKPFRRQAAPNRSKKVRRLAIGSALRRAATGATALALAFCLPAAVSSVNAEPMVAGDFSFSDELGGFTITGVRGTGTGDDPIVIEQSLTHTEPVTIVIRRADNAPKPKNLVGAGRWVAVHLKLVIRNDSGRVWQGFEVELQEILDKPSIRQDGLSFDQGALVPAAIISNRFTNNQRLFEPYDRIKFLEGHVNPLDFVDFKMHITDPTPVNTFYLLLDPAILFSLGPGDRQQSFG